MDANGLEKLQNVSRKKTLFFVGGWWEGGSQGMEEREGERL